MQKGILEYIRILNAFTHIYYKYSATYRGSQTIPSKDLNHSLQSIRSRLIQSSKITFLAKLLILTPGDIMKREKADRPLLSWQSGNISGHGSNAVVIIIHATDQRNSDLDL